MKIYMVYYDDSDSYNQNFRVIDFYDTEAKAIKETKKLNKKDPHYYGKGYYFYQYREYEVK